MKFLSALMVGIVFFAPLPVIAAGDAGIGEKEFKKCKTCHTIKNGDEVIYKGGKTGPNLYGVVGRAAGSLDFKYSKPMFAARDAGLIWNEEAIAEFIANPNEYLKQLTGDSKARSKMTFKAKKNAADLAAYLASVGPVIDNSDDQDSETTLSGEENNDS